MDTALWVAQAMLALVFMMTGLMKIAIPAEKLAERMGWVNDFTPVKVRLIGVVEMMGAIGIVVPALVDVLPELVPIAASGLALLMVGAVVTHVRRSEYVWMTMVAVLLMLSAFVAIGRFTS